MERRCDPEDVLVDECLETLGCILPSGPYMSPAIFARARARASLTLRRLTGTGFADGVSFKEALVMSEVLDEDTAHEKWLAFGRPFLDITSKYAMRMR